MRPSLLDRRIKHLGKTCALLLIGAWTASSHAQTVADQQESAELPATSAYIYWTNNNNGSIGRATTTGTDVDETFIRSITGGAVGGAGMTVDGTYIYWTSANGGTATTIARADLDGTQVRKNFITGAQNPCGVAVNGTYIYWAGDVGTSIGRADLNGTHVKQDFIETGNGVCGIAVTASYIYWGNYQTHWIGRAKLDGGGVNNNLISVSSPDSIGGGIAIKGDYIYFTVNTPAGNGTAIGRANLNGSNVNPNFITGLNGEIAFLAVDSNTIFWADWANGSGTTIGRAKLDGTGVNQQLIEGTVGGFGIAVTGGDP